MATDTQNHTAFFPGAQAGHFARLRKRLQHKGAQGATRRLRVIAGRERRRETERDGERRLKHERNQVISRRLVDAYPASLIGLEDLTHIRERRKRKPGKKASVKQRRANRHASQWAFAELQADVADKGLLFVCQMCHLTLHADLVGARNVALRTLLTWQDGVRRGVAPERPAVSGEEAKAVRRRREAEVRWRCGGAEMQAPALEREGL